MNAEAGAEDLPTNWGRWGDTDDRGTLNFITPSVTAGAVREASIGRVVSLAMPVRPVPFGGPIPFGTAPAPAGVMQVMNFTGSPPRALTDVLLLNTHHASLTHIDALAHVPEGTRVYPGVEISEVVRGGLTRGSTAAFVSGIVTRGVLLDVAAGGKLEPGHEVTSLDLEAAEGRAGVTVRSGDALIVTGGWSVADTPTRGQVPFIGLDAVRWIADREVSIYAGDISDPPPIPPTTILVLHQVALARLGMPLIDGVQLEELLAVARELKRSSFLLVVGPMAILGASGVPVNPLAIF